jgi:cytochrome c oxidase cbb3-type subunit 4
MMLDLLFEYAQRAGLLFFFTIFLGIVVWVMWPSKRKKFEILGNIPLKEDDNGR